MKRLLLILLCTATIPVIGQNYKTITTESWTNGAWVNSSKLSNTFDVNGYITENLSEYWNVSSLSWVNSAKTSYTNNSSGYAIQNVMQLWDVTTGNWKNYWKYTFTYNSSNKALTTITEYWVNGKWVNQSKQSNTYDGSGHLTLSVTEAWDTLSGTWENGNKTSYTNNGDGTVQQSISQIWDKTSGTWIYPQKITYTYNSSGKALTTLYENWTSGAWVIYSKQTSTYDGSGFLISVLSQFWNSSWINSSLNTYTNNVDGTVQQHIMQTWDINSSSWKNLQRATYTYPVSTRINGLDASTFGVFPNPCLDKLSIQLKENKNVNIEIKDLHGKILASKHLSTANTIVDVSYFPAGLYIINLMSEGNSEAIRFIKH